MGTAIILLQELSMPWWAQLILIGGVSLALVVYHLAFREPRLERAEQKRMESQMALMTTMLENQEKRHTEERRIQQLQHSEERRNQNTRHNREQDETRQFFRDSLQSSVAPLIGEVKSNTIAVDSMRGKVETLVNQRER